MKNSVEIILDLFKRGSIDLVEAKSLLNDVYNKNYYYEPWWYRPTTYTTTLYTTKDLTTNEDSITDKLGTIKRDFTTSGSNTISYD